MTRATKWWYVSAARRVLGQAERVLSSTYGSSRTDYVAVAAVVFLSIPTD